VAGRPDLHDLVRVRVTELGKDDRMSHDRRLPEDSEGVVPAPGYLVLTGLFLALYAAAEWVVPTFTAKPGLMLATVLCAPVLGVLVAAWQKRSRQRRTPWRSQRLGTAVVRIGMAGLAGASLILAQALTAESAQWMFVGMAGLTAAAAGHAWFRDR
jgi:hypothetical protein